MLTYQMLPPAEDVTNFSDPHPGRGHFESSFMRPSTTAIVMLVPGMKPAKLCEEIRLFLLFV